MRFWRWLFGFLSSGKKYIGVDPSSETYKGFEQKKIMSIGKDEIHKSENFT